MVLYSGTVKLILHISNSPPSPLSSFERQEQHFRIPYPCDKGSSEHGFVLWNSKVNFTYFQFTHTPPPPPPQTFLHSNVMSKQHFRIPYPCDKGSSEHGFVLWNSQANFTYFHFPPPPPPPFFQSNVMSKQHFRIPYPCDKHGFVLWNSQANFTYFQFPPPPSPLSSFERQEQHFRIPYPCDKGSSEHGFVLCEESQIVVILQTRVSRATGLRDSGEVHEGLLLVNVQSPTVCQSVLLYRASICNLTSTTLSLLHSLRLR